MTLPVCTNCGSADVIAVHPGSEKLSCVGIAYARGEPDVAWCADHWWKRFGVADLFRMPDPSAAASAHITQETADA